MIRLTVAYNVPPNAPNWFFECVQDGDWVGMLEYVDGKCPESIDFDANAS